MSELVRALGQDVTAIVGYVPRLVSALLIVLIGYVLARLLGRLVEAVLHELGLDELSDRTGLGATLAAARLPAASRVLGRLAYALVLAATVVQAVDALGLGALSIALRQLLAFAPHLVLATLILAGGAMLGETLGRATTAAVSRANVLYHALVGGLVRALVLLLALLLALQQLTIEATFLLAVLLVLLGGFSLAMAIALGWGTRTLAENLVAARYAEANFAIGDAITVEGVVGTIERIGPTSVRVRTAQGGTAVIPAAVLARTIVQPGPEPPRRDTESHS